MTTGSGSWDLAMVLRPFVLSDAEADALMSWASDPRVTRFQRRDPYTSKQQAMEYISTHILPHPWYQAICIHGRVVGSISAIPGIPGSFSGCRATLGYRLAFDYWGRGIATAAVKEAVVKVFAEIPQIERVDAIVDVCNPASQRVLEKAGFQKEAVMSKYLVLKGSTRDMIMYSILRS